MWRATVTTTTAAAAAVLGSGRQERRPSGGTVTTAGRSRQAWIAVSLCYGTLTVPVTKNRDRVSSRAHSLVEATNCMWSAFEWGFVASAGSSQQGVGIFLPRVC